MGVQMGELTRQEVVQALQALPNRVCRLWHE